MGERVAGELAGGDFRCQAGLHRGQVVGVLHHAAITLAAFLNDVLPQAAHHRARRIVECGAEIGERRRIGRRCRSRVRRCADWRGIRRRADGCGIGWGDADWRGNRSRVGLVAILSVPMMRVIEACHDVFPISNCVCD